jgi:hypothetical protein
LATRQPPLCVCPGHPARRRASRFCPDDEFHGAASRWNVHEITAQGPHLVVVLNGEKTADVQDGKHLGGSFALQYGSGVVKFRKVQIKEL